MRIRSTGIQESASTGAGSGTANSSPDPRAAMARGEVLELAVVGYIRGGGLVEWGDLQGFVPASRLMRLSAFTAERERREELRRLVN